MESIQRTALVQPELLSATPKKSDSKGVFGCIKDACIAVKNAPFEVKVLTGLGILCAVGSAASFTAMAFTSSSATRNVSEENEMTFKELKERLPNAILTSEGTRIGWKDLDNNIKCYADDESDGTTGAFVITSHEEYHGYTANKADYELKVGTNAPQPCEVTKFSLARVRNNEGVIKAIDTPTILINETCKVYDLTKTIGVEASTSIDDYDLDEILNCVKTDGTLGEFLTDLTHVGRRIMKDSSNKEESTAKLVRLANEYEEIMPNVGIMDALTFYTDVYQKKTLGERDAIREYLLMAGVSAAALSGIALLASGIISCVTCANSKVQIRYHMEGNSMTITKGKNKVFYELYDPLFKNKFSDGMVMACKYAMVHGSSIDDVYEMAVETADGVDKVLGHPAVGTKIIGDVQDWLHKHHRKDFEKYCKFFGIDYNTNELGIELDNV